MKTLLIGNYAADGQESMARYAQMLYEGLGDAGHDVTLALPAPLLNHASHPPAGWWKWVGYADKLVLAPRQLRRAARQVDIVHICDHSNAVYVSAEAGVAQVVTCHDLLAVRGALGEETDCPATFTGGLLQQAILRGLRRAHAVACVSHATLRDAHRLLPGYEGELLLTPNALNHPYGRLDAAVLRQRLAGIAGLPEGAAFVLHVGSNLRRKNRAILLQAFARIAASWNGKFVFAGEPLAPQLRSLAQELHIEDRIVEVVKPGNDVLEALYNGAVALLFPSRFEGFGWPIVEAQACGCAVICSDREPLPEVSGGAAILCDADDAEGFGRAIIEVASRPQRRDELARAGLKNATGYGRKEMIGRFIALYERLAENA